jgi:hypothetical protein
MIIKNKVSKRFKTLILTFVQAQINKILTTTKIIFKTKLIHNLLLIVQIAIKTGHKLKCILPRIKTLKTIAQSATQLVKR